MKIKHEAAPIGLLYLARIVKELFQKREAAQQARKALAVLAEEIGGCKNDLETDGPCYRYRKNISDWCESCRKKQPAWLFYRSKSAEAGAALRVVVRAGKEIAGRTENKVSENASPN